jgi:guanylate kinase
VSKSKTSNKKNSGDASVFGAIVIISAPSGCGKTTIVDRLLNRHQDWMRSISVTTRAPRFNEKDGVDYFFVDEPAFEKLKESDELLEYARVIDRSYGTPKKFVYDNLSRGKVVILEIDVQGAKKIRKVVDKSVPVLSVFVLPPSIKVLRERLEGRKTETPEQIQARIEVAQEEIKEAGAYDKTVVNQNLDQTVVEIEGLILDYTKKEE